MLAAVLERDRVGERHDRAVAERHDTTITRRPATARARTGGAGPRARPTPVASRSARGGVARWSANVAQRDRDGRRERSDGSIWMVPICRPEKPRPRRYAAKYGRSVPTLP